MSYSIKFLLISPNCQLDYDTRSISKKWAVKDEMRMKRLLLKVEKYFSSVESTPAYQSILGENASSETLLKEEYGMRETQALRIRPVS